jgi:long-chain acyl-CoA synthetase
VRPAMPTETIVQRLFDRAKQQPEAPAYCVRGLDGWQSTSFRQYADQVRRAARALAALGFQPGQTVSILGFNRPEWAIMDLACMAAGGAPAGIYTTCSPSEVAYIVNHAESPVVLVENAEQWQKVQAKKAELPKLRHVVTMKGAPKIDDPLVLGWEEFMAKAEAVEDAEVDRRVAALEPAALATLIYTSGTTGPPKGVMLSHDNLAWTASVIGELVGATSSDAVLSYLPLSHIAEQMVTLLGAATAGYAAYFAESVDKLPDNIKEVQPTIFFGVPRVWEKFHAGVSAKLAQTTGAKKQLVGWARGVATRVQALKNQGKTPGPGLALQYRLADKLIFSKLKPALGMGRARVCVSGAAPIAREVLEFFASLDIGIWEVYGQSEGSGPTSLNIPGKTQLGTVGPVLPGVEVKIDTDGEILVKGRNVFLGYYKEPEATKETLTDDGWLRSGDLGELDADGFLRITGRKKEIIITAGGKNITPKNIEAALKNHELVSEAVVIGDRRKFLSVLLTLDEEAARRVAGGAGALHESAAIRAELERAIEQVNQELARVETIKKFTILPAPFSIEGGELTPTMKVKRKVVAEKYAAQIEAMYAE